MLTETKWLTRREVQEQLKAAGLPSSHRTVDRYDAEPPPGWPTPRRINTVRYYAQHDVEAFIVRSRCSDLTPGDGVAA